MSAPTDKYKTVQRGYSEATVRARLGEPGSIIISEGEGEIIWEYNVPEWPAITFRYFFRCGEVITTQKAVRTQASSGEEAPRLIISEEAAMNRAKELFDQERIPAGAPQEDAGPEEVVKGFMSSMNRWETACWEHRLLIKKGEMKREHGEKLKLSAQHTVFDRYVTPINRKDRMSTSWPATYDPALDIVSEVNQETRSKFFVITRRKSGEKKRFTLLKKDGKWLIDSHEIDNTGSGWLEWWL